MRNSFPRTVPALLMGFWIFGLGELHARLGETENEMAARYGKPTKVESADENQKAIHFQDGGWTIKAVLVGGKCEKIVYRGLHHEAKQAKDVLLKLNGAELEWAPPEDTTATSSPGFMVRSDEQAYVQVPEVGGTYTFYTQTWAELTRKKVTPATPPSPKPND